MDMTATPVTTPQPVACQGCKEFKPSVILRWWGAVVCDQCDIRLCPAEAATAVRAPCVSKCCRGKVQRVTNDVFLDCGE